MRAGIVIVTHQSEAVIGACLDAALATGAEIVVVDNASADATRAEVRRRGVRLLANFENLGFAAGVNQGVRELSTPLILLLNPDAVIISGIEALAASCTGAGTAGAGGALIDANGSPQAGFMVRRLPSPAALACEALLLNRLWKRNPVNWHYRCLGVDYSKCQRVEQPAGAFLMIRRDVWEILGGFDEAYHPVWFEDVDFCKRATDKGFHFQFVPEAVAKHTGAHAVANITVENRRLYWYRSLLRYAAKHFGSRAERAVALAVMAGSLLRMCGEIALSRSLKPIAVYSRVLKLAGRHLLQPGGAVF